ncbi:Maf family protein [Deltaproteobacteria bacterium TL4]
MNSGMGAMSINRSSLIIETTFFICFNMTFISTRPLCLASSSPRRQDFLRRYGLQFECFSPDINESQHSGEAVSGYVLRVAVDKAQSETSRFLNHIILAGDTIVYHDHEILGKPQNKEDAHRMLHRLSNQSHTVFSAYAILDTRTRQLISNVVSTQVTFRSLTAECVHWYVNTTEPMDKAGAYSIQGLGALLIDSIQGSYNSVVGFPIEQILAHLLEKGWIVYSSPNA